MSSTELPGARFGDWISEGWKMFTEQWKAWVLLALGYFAVMLLPSMAVMFAAFQQLSQARQPRRDLMDALLPAPFHFHSSLWLVW